jgi:sugar/nucleoside kinase (ribokinase family)
LTSERDGPFGREAQAVIGGHICLDIIPEIKGSDVAFAEGFLQEIGKAVVATGGAVSNTGLAMRRLGIATLLMGKVGNDLFGQAVRQIVGRHDPLLAEGMIESPGAVTSYSVILSPVGRDRMVLHCPGCNDTFSAEEIAYARLDGVKLFHLGYPPLMRRLIERDGAELVELFRRAKATGVTTSLDMSMPDEASFAGGVDWRTILSRVLPYVDIFIPSFEETIYTLYPDKFRAFCGRAEGFIAAAEPELVRSIGRDLLNLGPTIVGLKLGRLGLYVATAPASRWAEPGRALPARPDEWHARELWSPGFRVNVVGTTGAGDATFAGFLAALLRGRPPEACVAFACAVGACNTEAADALGGVRSWDQTWDRIAAGWDRLVLPFPMSGWRWQEGEGVWTTAQGPV